MSSGNRELADRGRLTFLSFSAMRNRQQKQTNEELKTEEAYRQINEEEIVSAAVEYVPRDKLAQCYLCPSSSSPFCACGLMLMFQD